MRAPHILASYSVGSEVTEDKVPFDVDHITVDDIVMMNDMV